LTPVFFPRFLIIALPALVLLAAAGLELVKPRWLEVLVLLLLLALSSQGLVGLQREIADLKWENWRAATKYVLDNSESGDGVVFNPSYIRIPFEEYVQMLRLQAKAPQPIFPSAPWGELDQSNLYKKSPQRRGDYSRLWLILSPNYREGLPASPEIASFSPQNLTKRYCLRDQQSFRAVEVTLYQTCR